MARLYINRLVMVFAAALCLASCQTVSFPKIENIMKSPEFSEDAANIGEDYPDINEAPSAPTDIRSDKQWDDDARGLQALRDDSGRITMESGPSDAEATRQYERLRAKAQAYKKDDPRSGPVPPTIPNYKPRR